MKKNSIFNIVNWLNFCFCPKDIFDIINEMFENLYVFFFGGWSKTWKTAYLFFYF